MQQIMIGNQYAVKTSNASGQFVNVRFASKLKESRSWAWEDYAEGRPWEVFTKVSLSRGAVSAILALIIGEIKLALQHSDDDHMSKSLELLVRSLESGDLELHVESGKEWVRALNQEVDTYMGFMENYRDPKNLQLEYSSFVGIEDRNRSRAFRELTTRSAELTSKLPWRRDFEPDVQQQGDVKSFSSLVVTSYVANVPPRGVNLPNYEEAKLVGQKNFNLANVVEGKANFLTLAFLNEEDSELLRRFYVEAFTIKVGIHELLGHGSGLLLRKDETGKPNFDENLIDPTTNSKASHWYTPGATFASVFGSIASAYEELRANSIALYLACDPEVMTIFGHEGQQAKEVCLAVYLSQVFKGLTALSYYDAKAGWLSAHAQSEFVILRALMERLPSFIDFEDVGHDDIKISINRTLIPAAAVEAFADFVQKIQIYRLTANHQAGTKLFRTYSEVDEKWSKLREVVVAKKAGVIEPSFVQGNIIQRGGNGAPVAYKWIDYPASCEGLLLSWKERFSRDELRAIQRAVEEYMAEDI
ncbi:dipeptidyl peptidase 3 [Galendromus occidentalis]|uniref:Dipeptidyl peptidase 3 n=1 Tax=Galendromus occidentalis TaxID=34638 RepID=A0AAJ7WHN5_9ACAR|nr:dipeptidyl peptidase 3 [Galendromus occidentalis]